MTIQEIQISEKKQRETASEKADKLINHLIEFQPSFLDSLGKNDAIKMFFEMRSQLIDGYLKHDNPNQQ
jgi:hypothetical protein